MTAAASVVSDVFSVRLIDNFDADMSQAHSGTHVSTKLKGRRSYALALPNGAKMLVNDDTQLKDAPPYGWSYDLQRLDGCSTGPGHGYGNRA